MKVVGQRVFVVNAARTNFVFVKLYTDAGNRRRRRGDARMARQAGGRRARGGRALHRRQRSLRGRIPDRDDAPGLHLANRRCLQDRAGRDRGGLARYQRQGAGGPRLRASRAASIATGSNPTPTIGSTAPKRRGGLCRRRKTRGRGRLPRIEMGSVRLGLARNGPPRAERHYCQCRGRS